MKEPTIKVHRNVMTNTEEIAVLFASREHMQAWIEEQCASAISKAKAAALSDLQASARALFKDIFGKDL